jgi:hypothetical protein
MDGFGGDDGGFGGGEGGWGPSDADAGLGLAGGAGLIMTGGVLGALGNMVPPTPGSPPTAAAQRALLTEYKRMVADGLITEDDYQAVKSKVLGLQ